MILMGGIWILQGLNLAWGSLSRSFMQGDQHWALYGAILLIVGVCRFDFGATFGNGDETRPQSFDGWAGALSLCEHVQPAWIAL